MCACGPLRLRNAYIGTFSRTKGRGKCCDMCPKLVLCASSSASAGTSTTSGGAARAALQSASDGCPTSRAPGRGREGNASGSQAAAPDSGQTAQTRGLIPGPGLGRGPAGRDRPAGRRGEAPRGKNLPRQPPGGEPKARPPRRRPTADCRQGVGPVAAQAAPAKRDAAAAAAPEGKTSATAGRRRACGTQAGAGQGRPQPHEAGTREGPAGCKPDGPPHMAAPPHGRGTHWGGGMPGAAYRRSPRPCGGGKAGPKGARSAARAPQRGHEPTAEEPAGKGSEPPERAHVRASGAPAPGRRDPRRGRRPRGERHTGGPPPYSYQTFFLGCPPT